MRSLWIPLSLACLALPLACLAVPARGAKPTVAAGPFERTVRPFLAKNCFSCHNSKAKVGDVDLEPFRTAAAVGKDPHTWEKVALAIRTGQMPPKGSPQPPPAEAKAVAAWIEGEFARLERLAPPDPGRVTARRLNRAEYNNTVRDLLGVDFKPADDFPQDDSGYGFDNIGDVLSLSPALMEKYLGAAEKVARTAIFGPEPMKPTVFRHRPADAEWPLVQKPVLPYDETGLTLPQSTHTTYRFPVDGEYELRALLGGSRPQASEPLEVGIWVDGKLIQVVPLDPEGLPSFAIDKQDFSGKQRELRVRVPAGEHWVAASIVRMYHGLPASYGGPSPSTRKPPPPPDFSRFQPPADATPEQIERFRRRLEARRNQPVEIVAANDVKVRGIEIAGPYEAKLGPSEASRKALYTCGHLDGKHVPACERKIIGDLVQRAFRRPVRPEEVNRFLKLAALAKEQGDSFEEGLALAVQGVLVSPHFLFRIEQDRATPSATSARPISQHELATRLSYFLWSSTPDERLLKLADAQSLRKPEVLQAEVRRMLQDPKAAALVENFGGQWLELRKLEAVKPDRARFREWGDYLRMSVRQETEEFFRHIVRADRPILDFIDADYTFLNERLAGFYGVPGVAGPQFRRVTLSDRNRGGILTQASVLTVSSYATRTSPVLRGKWILDNILNTPPPPPPPDVPTLDEAKVGAAASLRQQLEEHRQNPTCASCHNRLDPLGFGLENFDAIGQWRTADGTFPIDASASLPDGRSFTGPAGLKSILKQDQSVFAACLTEKLLTYGLGRGLERYDKPAVKKIVAALPKGGYRFSALVLEIVNSLPFQMRRGDQPR